MIRVAQILGKMNGGGAEQVVMNYYRAIDREQVQFDFYLFKGSKYVPVEEIKSLGGRLFVLPTLKHPVKYFRTLRRLLSENGYRIMHCHLSTLSYLPLLAGKKAGVPVRILHNHSTSGGAREWLRNIAKSLFKPFARILRLLGICRSVDLRKPRNSAAHRGLPPGSQAPPRAHNAQRHRHKEVQVQREVTP